tara:strand:+ start:22400 stop:22744 length:345 start_codon:yes stop_codon:yes gene_type:complete
MKFRAKYKCQIQGTHYQEDAPVEAEFSVSELSRGHDKHLECLEPKKMEAKMKEVEAFLKKGKKSDSSEDFKSNEDLTVAELKAVLVKDYEIAPEDFKGLKKDDLVTMLNEKQEA